MQRQSVVSSNIKSIGYAPVICLLEVEFLDWSVYKYSDVPSSVYSGLMAASSKGTYLSQNVKGIYPYRKIR